ncbi:hypothetical protein EDD17DRAFT_1114588 [Pisolithus thermaeus]|nr:hypothetical protein EDD17DRAFT_1114588 [Pisolithus thermaeus]
MSPFIYNCLSLVAALGLGGTLGVEYFSNYIPSIHQDPMMAIPWCNIPFSCLVLNVCRHHMHVRVPDAPTYVQFVQTLFLSTSKTSEGVNQQMGGYGNCKSSLPAFSTRLGAKTNIVFLIVGIVLIASLPASALPGLRTCAPVLPVLCLVTLF